LNSKTPRINTAHPLTSRITSWKQPVRPGIKYCLLSSITATIKTTIPVIKKLESLCSPIPLKAQNKERPRKPYSTKCAVFLIIKWAKPKGSA